MVFNKKQKVNLFKLTTQLAQTVTFHPDPDNLDYLVSMPIANLIQVLLNDINTLDMISIGQIECPSLEPDIVIFRDLSCYLINRFNGHDGETGESV